ncbi:MAG: Uma2 family endonuclease [Spirulinaceae cyanobacterium]
MPKISQNNCIAVNVPPSVSLKLDRAHFIKLAQANRDLRLERTATGELIIMPPTGSDTGHRNLDIEGQLWLWNRQTQLGIAFNSSTGFHLPNGSDRSPDAAWIQQERWDRLSEAEKQGFAPICPDFVVELRSPTDNLTLLQAKMREYRENGAGLGWLINRRDRTVEIYRQNREVEVLNSPNTLSGEMVLPGFILDLTRVW